MGEQTNFIKVVVMRDGKAYRSEVLKSKYLGEDGKIRLPENKCFFGYLQMSTTPH